MDNLIWFAEMLDGMVGSYVRCKLVRREENGELVCGFSEKEREVLKKCGEKVGEVVEELVRSGGRNKKVVEDVVVGLRMWGIRLRGFDDLVPSIALKKEGR